MMTIEQGSGNRARKRGQEEVLVPRITKSIRRPGKAAPVEPGAAPPPPPWRAGFTATSASSSQIQSVLVEGEGWQAGKPIGAPPLRPEYQKSGKTTVVPRLWAW